MGAALPKLRNWRLRLDPADAGIAGEWFQSAGQWSDLINLPGSTDEQHFGHKNDRRDAGHLTHAYEFVGPACTNATS
jgi:hypothetical protein